MSQSSDHRPGAAMADNEVGAWQQRGLRNQLLDVHMLRLATEVLTTDVASDGDHHLDGQLAESSEKPCEQVAGLRGKDGSEGGVYKGSSVQSCPPRRRGATCSLASVKACPEGVRCCWQWRGGVTEAGRERDSTRPRCSAASPGSAARPRWARNSSSGPATTSDRMNDPAARTRTTACGMSSSSLSTAAAKSTSSRITRSGEHVSYSSRWRAMRRRGTSVA